MICTITFVWHYLGVGVWLDWFRMKATSVSMQCVVVHTRPQIWTLGATKRGVGARLVHMCGFVCRKLGSPLTSARVVALHILGTYRVYPTRLPRSSRQQSCRFQRLLLYQSCDIQHPIMSSPPAQPSRKRRQPDDALLRLRREIQGIKFRPGPPMPPELTRYQVDKLDPTLNMRLYTVCFPRGFHRTDR
jgi:hypothetical protein